MNIGGRNKGKNPDKREDKGENPDKGEDKGENPDKREDKGEKGELNKIFFCQKVAISRYYEEAERGYLVKQIIIWIILWITLYFKVHC